MGQYGFIFFVLLLFPVVTQAQDRNFEVISETTSCDELPKVFENNSEALGLIVNAKYRLHQNFKIRRKKGLQSGEFYSCDNQVGYLIIWIDQDYEIYREVALDDWETLISSNDPENILETVIIPNYVRI